MNDNQVRTCGFVRKKVFQQSEEILFAVGDTITYTQRIRFFSIKAVTWYEYDSLLCLGNGCLTFVWLTGDFRIKRQLYYSTLKNDWFTVWELYLDCYIIDIISFSNHWNWLKSSQKLPEIAPSTFQLHIWGENNFVGLSETCLLHVIQLSTLEFFWALSGALQKMWMFIVYKFECK